MATKVSKEQAEQKQLVKLIFTFSLASNCSSSSSSSRGSGSSSSGSSMGGGSPQKRQWRPKSARNKLSKNNLVKLIFTFSLAWAHVLCPLEAVGAKRWEVGCGEGGQWGNTRTHIK